jgi:small subunit ribosomal protein S16
MSVRVRLTRVGSKKNPIWRVVVADQRSPRDGRFIETIGHYNPQTEPSTIRIDEERFQHWVARGAQPTGTVKQLMKAQAKGLAADPKTSAAVAAASPATAAPVSMEPATPPSQLEEQPAEAEAPTEAAEPAAEAEAEAAPAEEAAPEPEAEAAPAEEAETAPEAEAPAEEADAAEGGDSGSQ